MNPFEGEQIFFTDQNLVQENESGLQQLSLAFQKFIKEWTFNNQFIYR